MKLTGYIYHRFVSHCERLIEDIDRKRHARLEDWELEFEDEDFIPQPIATNETGRLWSF